jgi:Sulfotransferase family
MIEKEAIPTIDLSHPHRSMVARMVETLRKPRRIELDSLKHADSLDLVTKGNCAFLLKCIEESAELNAVGSLLIENMVKEILLNHHQVAERFKVETFPSIKDPIFILGLPRTGSTYLFNLLGASQRFRTLTHWETHGVASRTPAFLKRMQAAFLLKLMHHLSPGFRTVHEIRLEGPEECTKPVLDCFVSQAFPSILHIPRYNDFLETADYLPTYEFYYRQLQILGSGGKRWLLKTPIHIQSIDSILKVFPDAKFIHLHRDLNEVLGSICSLAAAYRCMTSRRVNGMEIGSEVRKFLTRDLAKAKAVLNENRDKVLNIHFREIVDQPIATVRRVFDFVGSPYDDGVEQSLKNEMEVSVPNKFGKHVYRFEDYFPDGADQPESKP